MNELEERLGHLEEMADRLEEAITARLRRRSGEAGGVPPESSEARQADLMVGVAVERTIAATGRCVCGRRPTVRERLRRRLQQALR